MAGQQKGNGKKTGNWSNPQFSRINTSDFFTGYDTINSFNLVLLKKIGKIDQSEPVAGQVRARQSRATRSAGSGLSNGDHVNAKGVFFPK